MMTPKNQLKLDERVQSLAKRLKKVGYIALVGAGAGFAIYCLVAFNAWSQTHRFQAPLFRSPVVFRNPIVRGIIETKSINVLKGQNIAVRADSRPVAPKKGITPTPMRGTTEKEIVLSYEHGEILWKIYQLESGRGKADYCRLEGRGFAGFGVLDNGKIVCYDNFSYAAERAEYWLVKNGVDQNLKKALCVWSGNKQAYEDTGTCIYYQSYLSL